MPRCLHRRGAVEEDRKTGGFFFFGFWNIFSKINKGKPKGTYTVFRCQRHRVSGRASMPFPETIRPLRSIEEKRIVKRKRKAEEPGHFIPRIEVNENRKGEETKGKFVTALVS